MQTYVALLRAINVGGHGKVGMSELRDAIASAGFEDVRTILQTGNVVFLSRASSTSSMEKRLASVAAEKCGVTTEFFVRTAVEWPSILEGNPFTREAIDDPQRLIVMLLRDAPSMDAIEALRAAIRGRERVDVKGREAFVYPDGMGTSKLTNTVIEKKLATRATARNWNTVMKIQAVAGR